MKLTKLISAVSFAFLICSCAAPKVTTSLPTYSSSTIDKPNTTIGKTSKTSYISSLGPTTTFGEILPWVNELTVESINEVTVTAEGIGTYPPVTFLSTIRRAEDKSTISKFIAFMTSSILMEVEYPAIDGGGSKTIAFWGDGFSHNVRLDNEMLYINDRYYTYNGVLPGVEGSYGPDTLKDRYYEYAEILEKAPAINLYCYQLDYDYYCVLTNNSTDPRKASNINVLQKYSACPISWMKYLMNNISIERYVKLIWTSSVATQDEVDALDSTQDFDTLDYLSFYLNLGE